MKMFNATIPTNMAASHSIVLIILSMTFSLRFVIASPPYARQSACRSQRGLVLGQAGLERVHHRLRVLAHLLHALGPLRLAGRRGLAPGVELLGRELVDLVAGLAGD